jgi:putative ABC transport system substrate-binding protein
MNRREFITLFGGAVAAWPLRTVAQARARPLIASLAAASAGTAKPQLDAFFQGLGALNYVEGRDFDFQARWADGDNERLFQLAHDLVALKPDVIFANPTPAVVAARAVTRSPNRLLYACRRNSSRLGCQ